MVKGRNYFGLNDLLTKVKILFSFCFRSKVILHFFYRNGKALRHVALLYDVSLEDKRLDVEEVSAGMI